MSKQVRAAAKLGGTGATNAQLILRLLKLTWHYRWHAIRLLLTQSVMLALMLLGLSFIGLGIDVLSYQVMAEVSPPRYPLGLTPPADWSAMVIMVAIALAALAIAAVQFLLERLNTIWKVQLVQDVVVDLRIQVYDKLQRLSFRFFDANESGAIINRVTGDVQAVRRFIDGVMVEVLMLGLALSFFTGYMLSIHALLTVACLATTPLLWVLTAWFSQRVRPAYRRNRELFDETVRIVAENVQAMPVIKGFWQQEAEIEKFTHANRQVRDQKYWIFRQVSFFTPLIAFLPQLNLVVLLLFGGYLFFEGSLALGSGLVVFSAVLQQFSRQVGNIAPLANAIQQSLIGAQRVFEILDAPVEVQSPPKPVPLKRARGEVEFQQVSFSYAAKEEGAVPALREVSFHVSPGQSIAILGTMGAGKSTLLSLIPRFYDPLAGRVMIDGIDVRDYDLRDLRRNIGVVFQESFLFSDTIAHNIAFGHPEVAQKQIVKAAKIAAAHPFIMETEQGYGALVGERGVGLSGGQRQRLAIARAILLDPPILLLDDPTAAVDAETEQEILNAMNKAMQGRTTFIVAHRLSTLRRADSVLVLQDGRIAQHGTHAELLNRDGYYRQAVALQITDAESHWFLDLEGESVA
jgi:ATP-binding cassette, subfamily B, bacterial